MSYQVLARKYRPALFSEVVGQEHVLKALKNSIEHNRLHQAYIFSGTRGVGKTTIARVFAKCLNCLNGDMPQVEPCNICTVCEEIKVGRHLEFIELDAASRTGVDDMRDLLESTQYKPTNARYKIYLIDEVHMLSASSFNALLKTLEEPPSYVMFLMATTMIKKVPKTVLSRCLQLNLKAIPQAQIKKHIGSLLDLESISYDDESISLIADSAQGSIRDGLTLLDQAIAHGNGSLTADQVKALLGTIDQSYIIELVREIAAGNGDGAYNAFYKITELNVEYEQVLRILISVFHQIVLHQEFNNNDSEPIQNLAQSMEPQIIQLHYEIALNALSKFHVHPNPKEAFELCILRMLAFHPAEVDSAAKQEKKNFKINSSSKVQPKITKPVTEAQNRSLSTTIDIEISDKQPVLMDQQADIDLSNLDLQSWNKMFESLELSMFIKQVFSEFEFKHYVDQVVTLKKSDDLISPTENLKSGFRDAVSKYMGTKISLEIESGEVVESPAVAEKQKIQSRLDEDKLELLENPTVKDIIDSFDGKIIDKSIKKVSP
jgi:DNA polymerase-3 subunit gamma/tau